MTPHIVVVGSTMIDLVAYVDRLPVSGQTVIGRRSALGFGGKGANQAVMAAKLGARITFVNRVGDDLFGRMVRTNLADRGIDGARVKVIAGEPTGVAQIWVEEEQATNRIIVVPGANQMLCAADVTADLADVGAANCVVCQLEVPPEAALAAFSWARSNNAVTILNPAPAAPLDDELLNLTDWVVPNETEFASLFATEPDDAGLLGVAAGLAGRLVVTLGERGAAAVIDGSVIRSQALAVDAVDTTGAGDAFMGGFAYCISAGASLVDALSIATRCGSLSTTRYGTQTSFPDAAEVGLGSIRR